MRIYVDSTEPGIILQDLFRRGAFAGIAVERTVLHKLEGLGPAHRETHPFYGLGADLVITDASRVPLAAIERKTLEDLAKSAGFTDHRVEGGTKLFRQLRDLLAHPMPVLILEVSPSMLHRRMEPAVLGTQMWCAREGISIVYSTGPLATAHGVLLLAKRLAREASSREVEHYVRAMELNRRERPDGGKHAESARESSYVRRNPLGATEELRPNGDRNDYVAVSTLSLWGLGQSRARQACVDGRRLE